MASIRQLRPLYESFNMQDAESNYSAIILLIYNEPPILVPTITTKSNHVHLYITVIFETNFLHLKSILLFNTTAGYSFAQEIAY